jgi:hypothetical protein
MKYNFNQPCRSRCRRTALWRHGNRGGT